VSCYNASRWLREAVASVLAQTFSDFELILVDDGSTDDTWTLIEGFRAADDRVVAVRKENTGLTQSLNAALRIARGEWIARMDADDLCEPTRLEQQIRFVREHPDVVLLGTGFLEVNPEGSLLKTHRYPTHHRRLVWHLEHMARFFPHSSAFFRSHEARKVKGYNPRLQRAQDWRLWLDLSKVGTLACLRQPLVRIRKHPGQISLTGGGRRQVCDAMAGTVGHLLGKAGYTDPCSHGNDAEWTAFLAWVEKKVDQSGLLERRARWNDARERLLSTPSRVKRGFAFGARLSMSGHAVTLLTERIFGLSLPRRLVQDWIATCAV
jgi:glycosyltransferase involved in cell wall biosynthesis